MCAYLASAAAAATVESSTVTGAQRSQHPGRGTFLTGVSCPREPLKSLDIFVFNNSTSPLTGNLRSILLTFESGIHPGWSRC